MLKKPGVRPREHTRDSASKSKGGGGKDESRNSGERGARQGWEDNDRGDLMGQIK